MADPVLVTCPLDTWTKVATNAQTGWVWIMIPTADYIVTHVDTAGAAPTDDSKGIEFQGSGMPISSSVGIDVYVKARRVAGQVRVDL